MFVNAGFANPAVAGYFSRKTSTNSFYKMTFPTDTVSTTASGTSSDFGVYGMSALANPAVAGYFTAAWGGISGGAATNIIYKMSFYDETISTTTSAPSTFSNSTGGFANG
jgi:hypothetical protein